MEFDVEAIRDVSDEGDAVVGFALGDTGPAVAEIRARLARIDLLQDDESDVFDQAVDAAVRRFQQRRGISIDGVVGPHTFRRLEEARWRLGDRPLSFSPGHMMVGDDVLALQTRLTQLGFQCGRADGVFGPNTDKGLREFQQNSGLITDGIAAIAVFRALNRLQRTVSGGDGALAGIRLREEVMIESMKTGLTHQTIMIDPGHGGLDAGHWGNGQESEADLALDIAERIEGRLGARGAQVMLSRPRLDSLSETPTEKSRAALANRAGATLVLSLHADASPCPEANGVSVYYYGLEHGVHSIAGELFAELLLDHVVAASGMQDCRTHYKTWDLLRLTKMPAVRVELGYLTNPNDYATLANARHRDDIAGAVVEAMDAFFRPV